MGLRTLGLNSKGLTKSSWDGLGLVTDSVSSVCDGSTTLRLSVGVSTCVGPGSPCGLLVGWAIGLLLGRLGRIPVRDIVGEVGLAEVLPRLVLVIRNFFAEKHLMGQDFQGVSQGAYRLGKSESQIGYGHVALEDIPATVLVEFGFVRVELDVPLLLHDPLVKPVAAVVADGI